MREEQIQEEQEGRLSGEPYKAERDNKKTRDCKHMAEKIVSVG